MISVIVTIYNVEEYLPTCIESILCQTYKKLEIFLVNDGSTDSSKEICIKYCNQDPRIRFINQINQGVSAARNIGLKKATGKYIYFIDGDDYIHPQTLEILASYLHDDIYDFSMITGIRTYNIISKSNNIPLFFSKKTLSQHDLLKGLFNFAEEEELQYQVVWNKLYRKKIINELYFKKTGSEDTEFNCRVFQQCRNAIWIKIPLYHWFQRNSSITHQPINNNYIDRMNSYYSCYYNLLHNQNKLKDYSLEKMYKTMINIRYYTTNTRFNHEVLLNIRNITSKTFYDFLTSSIPWYKKLGLSIFLYIPFIYNIFMYLCERIQSKKK